MTWYVRLCLVVVCWGTSVFSSNLLLVSNYPEKVSEPGTVFNHAMTFQSLRLLYYHHNVANQKLYYRMVIRNDNEDAVTLRVLKGQGGPDKDGIFVGHQSTKRYLEGLRDQAFDLVTVPGGDKVELVYHLFKPDMVTTGLVYIENPSQKPLSVGLFVEDPQYPFLSGFNEPLQSSYQVGVYLSNKIVTTVQMDCRHPIKEISLGRAPYLHGSLQFPGVSMGAEEPRWESISNSVEGPLKGNYGVLYTYKMTLANPTNQFKKVSLFFSPVAGASRGTFLINNELYDTVSTITNELYPEPELIKEMVIMPGDTRHITLHTIPEAGSHYPVHLVLQSSDVRQAYHYDGRDKDKEALLPLDAFCYDGGKL